MARTPGSVAVIGGGVIGVVCAWRAAQRGWSVTLYDPHPGAGATDVAGGMLGALSEGWPGEANAMEVGEASLRRWSAFDQELSSATGAESVITAHGCLMVAADASSAADVDRVAHWLEQSNRPAQRLRRSEIRDQEPTLAHIFRRGLLCPDEFAVDNRCLFTALWSAAQNAGMHHLPRKIGSIAEVEADRIVIAAGAWSDDLYPLGVRPVKGEILRLSHRTGALAPPRHYIRSFVNGRAVYIVPRTDGVVVGASQYEAGFDPGARVGGVLDLLEDAVATMPALREYNLMEASAGYRPASPDNIPFIGYVDDRVIVATGHGRNGILLTPLTGDLVAAMLEETDDEMSIRALVTPERVKP